jgi:hypothetical protein
MTDRPDPDRVLSAHLDGEAVLLHMDSKRYYRLNETGQRIWRLLEQGVPVPEIPGRLAAEFEVEAADAEREVADFLAALRDRDLLPDTGGDEAP